MKHGSLESGIGMFDYAAEKMGWDNVFHCEINDFCRTVLNYYWPKAKSYANVFGFNGNEWRGKVDIITCGFPCQPFSNAGKREGSKDDRHIWPENMRIIREAQPAYVLAENVPGLITIENGVVFEQVCLDLENEGYEVATFIIPAVATDKDHRRDRVWIVARNDSYANAARQRRNERQSKDEDDNGINTHSKSIGERSGTDSEGGNDTGGQQLEGAESGCNVDHAFINDDPDSNSNGQRNFNGPGKDTGPQGEGKAEGNQRQRVRSELGGNGSNATNAGSQRQPGPGEYRRSLHSTQDEIGQVNRTVNGSEIKESWIEAATRLCVLDDGNTGELDLTAISKSKWRTESLKSAGNTIVWEIAFELFKSIEETL